MKLLVSMLIFMFAAAAYGAVAPTLTLHSPSFQHQGMLPKLYTCDGSDISPALSWSGLPANTKSLVLILSDIDAPSSTFYHWGLYNIPPTVSAFPQNMNNPPRGVMTVKNNWNKAQYNGPCPPKGAAHYYIFTLYALDTKLALPASADTLALLEAMQNHIIEKAELSATYGR